MRRAELAHVIAKTIQTRSDQRWADCVESASIALVTLASQPAEYWAVTYTEDDEFGEIPDPDLFTSYAAAAECARSYSRRCGAPVEVHQLAAIGSRTIEGTEPDPNQLTLETT